MFFLFYVPLRCLRVPPGVRIPQVEYHCSLPSMLSGLLYEMTAMSYKTPGFDPRWYRILSFRHQNLAVSENQSVSQTEVSGDSSGDKFGRSVKLTTHRPGCQKVYLHASHIFIYIYRAVLGHRYNFTISRLIILSRVCVATIIRRVLD
jgi:hypothetical protein